jgi:hypothetical protein
MISDVICLLCAWITMIERDSKIRCAYIW